MKRIWNHAIARFPANHDGVASTAPAPDLRRIVGLPVEISERRGGIDRAMVLQAATDPVIQEYERLTDGDFGPPLGIETDRLDVLGAYHFHREASQWSGSRSPVRGARRGPAEDWPFFAQLNPVCRPAPDEFVNQPTMVRST